MRKPVNRQLIIPSIGALGLLVGVVFSFSYGRDAEPKANYLSLPPSSPYGDTVWGTGIIEASSKNIAVGSYLPGIIAKVFVTENDQVEAGTPIFQLDDRTAQSEFQMRVSAVEAAAANLKGQEAVLADQEDQLRRLQGLKAGVEVSHEKLQRAVFEVDKARAGLAQAAAQLEVARAEEKKAEVLLEQMTVTAPVAGRIMKINVRPGELVTTDPSQNPPVLMGNDRPLFLRVSIEENELWRFDPSAPAKASLRGHKDIQVPLTFVRTEPYVMPKQQLNNTVAERIDTRTLEVMYRIDGENPQLFIGQQMDVFIQASAKAPVSAP
jgi:RND family efflux transporter MFP subunit